MRRTLPFLLLAGVAGCPDATSKEIFLQVTSLDPSCGVKCEQSPLNCVSFVKTTIQAVGQPAISIDCLPVTRAEGAQVQTLCTPQMLFAQPLWEKLPPGRIELLSIEGFAGTEPTCDSRDRVFTALTSGSFDLKEIANSTEPVVAMRASCSSQNSCTPLVCFSGTVESWPETGAAPDIPNPTYSMEAGFVNDDGPRPQYQVQVEPRWNSVTQRFNVESAPVPKELASAICSAFRVRLQRSGQTPDPPTVPTLFCLDTPFDASCSTMVNARMIGPAIAPLLNRAPFPPDQLSHGILVGQVRRAGASVEGATISFTPGDGALRLFYLDRSGQFVSSPPGTGPSGIFALARVTDGSNRLNITASTTAGAKMRVGYIVSDAASVLTIDVP